MATDLASDIEYLKSLQAVRERSRIVLERARNGSLNNFIYDESRMKETAEFVAGVISRDFGPDRYSEIPPHGRWEHFSIGGVPRLENLVEKWQDGGVEDVEITRRLIDLFFVSVLLDAGAGDTWSFREPGSDKSYGRSEGIAVASLYMFNDGAFNSATDGNKAAVDGRALSQLTEDTFIHHFQVGPQNPIVGSASRIELLNNFGKSLLALPDVFGETGRPGLLVDFLLKDGKDKDLNYETLWDILQRLLLPAWPSNRPRINGQPIGDAWPLRVLQDEDSDNGNPTTGFHPFHKLTQWLGYSLTVPFMKVLKLKWINIEKGTGLPEYRNGGLFIDMGVLKLKPEVLSQGAKASGQALPLFSSTGDVIVEWRGMTVALLDELHKLVNDTLAPQGVSLSLPQLLEAGSWKSGRELAAKYRPETRSSPILIDGDGTLF
ncbi:hypothetical protein M441DRAFT_195894 [Trichoderma asperellum CBS 433.97]|uniref:Uracil catabolism protein 4 n=1 Tax=Trichoderma asperellum (strain ATCC 204424 / CBS 433.97 / NBRC 101777) TaxID=1042311 RepID=A0A2T3Z665_TRIA4|nr:hypothetical protein M441DRAFT_195894 [Trichoderma asperellum CBS 433.97]PTB40287.1 hypothetical protein M441DRAFT_195894 [Trichoderma asperellum CBS 433.97]